MYAFVSQLQSHGGACYIQSPPILTRLQASVIYVLTRAFEHTAVFVIPSASSPHLLFLFETFGNGINEEYQTVEQQLVPSSTASLLQFVHIHQLLGTLQRDSLYLFVIASARSTICLSSYTSKSSLFTTEICDGEHLFTTTSP